MNYSQVLEHLKHEVIRFYKEREEPGLTYHNLQHTQDVVAHAVKFLNHYQLNDKEAFIVMVAAWYHDIGYFSGGATGHEERGAAMAETFLRDHEADEEEAAEDEPVQSEAWIDRPGIRKVGKDKVPSPPNRIVP